MKRGITTTLEEGNPHLRKGGVVVPLQQQEKALGLITMGVEIDASSGAPSPGITAALTNGITGASSPGIATALTTGITGASSPEIAKALTLGVAGRSSPRAAGASSPGAAGTAPPDIDAASSPEIIGSSSSGTIGASASSDVTGASSTGADGASLLEAIEALSPEVDGLTPPTSPGVAQAVRTLRTTRTSSGTKHNSETDCELKGVHTLTVAEGQPRVNSAAGPLDFTHGDGDPLLKSTAFVYTRKSTSGFLFFTDGGPISIEDKAQTLTA